MKILTSKNNTTFQLQFSAEHRLRSIRGPYRTPIVLRIRRLSQTDPIRWHQINTSRSYWTITYIFSRTVRPTANIDGYSSIQRTKINLHLNSDSLSNPRVAYVNVCWNSALLMRHCQLANWHTLEHQNIQSCNTITCRFWLHTVCWPNRQSWKGIYTDTPQQLWASRPLKQDCFCMIFTVLICTRCRAKPKSLDLQRCMKTGWCKTNLSELHLLALPEPSTLRMTIQQPALSRRVKREVEKVSGKTSPRDGPAVAISSIATPWIFENFRWKQPRQRDPFDEKVNNDDQQQMQ